ncbi:hypothetical protein SAY86_012906 [Trapa natans]|uniref:Uncharacterized protein n=1 Tax=Trapa natans TaxID=22666 RepID=A0AAN7R9M2_TRANT|nr:hypothetical protein SAY86_012906 [Trapa natans]
MDMETSNERADFVDWQGRRSCSKKHGGARTAAFTCVVEVLENMVFLSNATNFIAYFQHIMHYPTAVAANMVTNFMGTAFLFPLLGGYIGDSFLTRFKTFVLFCTLELLGLVMLTVQAHKPGLQPPEGKTPDRSQAAMLYIGLYATAIGVGGIKAALPAHGADQFDQSNQRAISAFFNWFFFSLCAGGLITSIVMMWIEENLGWKWSFKISITALSVAFLFFVAGFPIYRYKVPSGSAFTRICKVLVLAIGKRKAPSANLASNDASVGVGTVMIDRKSSYKFKFLDKALVDSKMCTSDVEETRTFMGLLPIFASTIMMNCCLAQLQTFTVQQGSVMDRTIRGGFKIPTQSLTVFPIVIMLASIPLYEWSAHLKSLETLFQPLRRIGIGLTLASASMAAAAIVESRRRQQYGANMSVFWLCWQYVLLGVSDMLTLGGMLEFFYSEAPDRLRSMSTALSWCSMSMGYFLSSMLVTITDLATARLGKSWLGQSDLNHGRLDLYYAALCLLNFINLLNYIYWAKKY